jgi:hypothetical protein
VLCVIDVMLAQCCACSDILHTIRSTHNTVKIYAHTPELYAYLR